MDVTVEVNIAKPKEVVWAAIIDIENSPDIISSILSLEVLNKPNDGLVGFKWKETRVMFGKESTETMWITDYSDNEYYRTRAENHGAIYVTKLLVSSLGEYTLLTMTFTATSESIFVRAISSLMFFFIKKSMVKALQADLDDIKKYLEKS